MMKLLKQVFNILPKALKDYIRRKRLIYKIDTSKEIKRKTVISSDELNEAIRNLGIDRDFIVHSSMSSLGKFQGGPKEVANCFKNEAQLKNVTMIFPALPFNTTMYEYLKLTSEYDIGTAPNKMGAVSSVIGSIPYGIRTKHPTHSCLVIGEKKEFYADVDYNEPTFGSTSPYYKLFKENGLIVLFGVNLESVTNMHVVEDLLGKDFPIDVYLGQTFDIIIMDHGHKIGTAKVRCHDPKIASLRVCEQIRPALLSDGFLKSFPLGAGKVEVLSARGLVLTQLRLLLNGKSIYGHVKLNNMQIIAVKKILENIA